MNQDRIQILKKLIKEDSNDPFNQYALSLEYIEEEPNQALTLLTNLHTNIPTYLPTYYTLGNLIYEIGDNEKAKKILLEGLDIALSQGEEKIHKELKNLYQTILYEDE